MEEKRILTHEDFAGLINSIASEYAMSYSNSVMDFDDYRSELWIRFFEITEEEKKKPNGFILDVNWQHPLPLTMREISQVFSWIKSCLKNKSTDIVRDQSRKTDTSMYRAELTEQIVMSAKYIMDSLHAEHPATCAETKCLEGLLTKFAKSRGGNTEKFIMSAINPSKELLDQWETYIEKAPRLKHFVLTPPFTLAKLIGLQQKEVYFIHFDLADFLRSHGYTIMTDKSGNPYV
jgi:hypothetical protein